MFEMLVAWLLAYKYFLLFPIAIVEGPIIAIIAGSLAASGQIHFSLAYCIIVTGDLVADSAYYAIGSHGRSRFINRWGKFIGVTEARVAKIDNHFSRHAGITLFLGKLAFSMEIPFIVAAGIAQYPYRKFLGYMTLGALPKTMALMLVGYFFGYTLVNAKHDLLLASRFAFGGVVLVALILLTRHLIQSRGGGLPRSDKTIALVKKAQG